jgi:outer membrane protein assembly factor BamE (lipoprotein component of BamABCDE complex)
MKIVGAVLALALLAGCVSVGTQVKDSALEQFQKGVTTEADVVKALGPPQSITTSTEGLRMLTYMGLHSQPKAASFIPVVGLFAGGADTTGSYVSFRFDKDGKLADITSQQNQMSGRMGAPAQPAAPAPATPK